ncbi:MAG: LamG-like jellyroll fold domain-containing protein [Planctomycetota bacterium]
MRALPLVVLLGSASIVAQRSVVHEALDAADARWHGAVAIADGALGGAARFDGDRAHVEVGPCPVASDAPFTLRCRLRTQRGAFCTPLMARDGERVGLSLVMGREPGKVSFEAWSWGSVRLLSRGRVDDGAWHAIEVCYEPRSNVAALFVDSECQAHATLGEGASPTAQLRLGDNIGAHQPFAGDLDEVEVLAAANHAELLAQLQPVLGREACERSLRELRGRLLPKVTPSLDEAAAANWPARRLAVRAHVADALGLVPPPPAVPLEFVVHGEVARGGVRLQRVSWIGFPGYRATGWLWLPVHPASGRRPAVLCPHGHWQDGARHPVVQARCAAMALFGWTVLAVDSVHVEHVASGVNSVGAMTWHNQRALDVLLQRDDVDPARVAVTGASGGGQQTYYLMALEDRLCAAAPMVMACYLDEILAETSAHCGCNHTPRLAVRTDVPEMCAVFAPKPVLFGSVTGDWTHDFPQQGLPELRALWQRLGGPAVRSRHGDEGHNYDRPMREVVYALLTDVFAPSAGGVVHERREEPEFAALSLGELRGLVAACANVQLDPGEMAEEYLARRAKVASLAELAPGLDLTVARREIVWREGGADDAWRVGTVTGADGVAIPLRVGRAIDPARPFTVVVDPRGAAAAMLERGGEGEPQQNVVLVDPRPYGEWAPFRSAWQRNGIFLGRGESYQAALDVATVCASLPGEVEVHVVGRGEAGVVVLLAAHLCPRIRKVTVDELGPSYADDGNRRPLCPELLRFRDLPELIAKLPEGCAFEAIKR